MPGEIWVVNRDAHFDTNFATVRYLTILREPQNVDPKLVSVMVLSEEIEYLSDINILIPPAISGLSANVLAETGNVGEMPIEYLQYRIGNRLSRQIYDLLLSIGDFARGVAPTLPSRRSIQSLGLQIGADLDRLNSAAIRKFELHERAWLLSCQPAKIDRIANLVTQAIEIEREFIEIAQERIDLSQWFQNIFPAEWQELTNFNPNRRIFARSSIGTENIADLLLDLKASNDPIACRKLINRLSVLTQRLDPSGEMLISEIIQTLLGVIDLTEDEETFWSAIGCLRQLNPVHPQIGIRRQKSVDLGQMINLVINIVARQERKFALLLQVYPQARAEYLPIDLKLVLADEIDLILSEIMARSHDYCLQLKFSGEVGEAFNIGLELDEVRAIERFIL